MAEHDVERFERERLEADRAYNNALTALDRAANAAIAQPGTPPADVQAMTHALIVFLQHITAFVESKDRELAARAGARVDRVEQALESVDEMRTQIRVLQRGVQMLARSEPSPAPTTSA